MDIRRISRLVQTKPGQTLDTHVLGQDLKRIYAIGSFEIVSYEIVEEGTRHILRIKATPKSWGPTYLKLGLFLATDFQLATNFGVVGLIEATEMNRLGGMWKTTFTIGSPLEIKTRFYQPLTYAGHAFVSPHAEFNQNLVRVYDEDGNALGTYQATRGGGGFDLGYDFGTWGEFRLGYFRDYGKARRKVGDPQLPNASWDEGGISSGLRRRPDRQREPSACRLSRRGQLQRLPQEPREHGRLRQPPGGAHRRPDDRPLDRAREGGGRHQPPVGQPVLRKVRPRRASSVSPAARRTSSSETTTRS